MRITADNITVHNFTIRNSGGYSNNAGIIIHSHYNTIINCSIYRTKTGIAINASHQNTLAKCTFYINGEGILVHTAYENSISNCTFFHNAIGIHVEHSTQLSISGSCAYTNGIGCFVNNSSAIIITHCALYNNNDNQGGIFLTNCRNSNIFNCNIQHNGVGISLKNSSRIWVTQCNISWNTHFAIILRTQSEDIIITKCNIHFNLRYALHLKGRSTAVASANNIYGNILHGVYAENARCIARSNWWGSTRGPTFFDFGRSDRITCKGGLVVYLPWLFSPVERCGVDWEIETPSIAGDLPPARFIPIPLPGNDTDSDGAPDWWEQKWGYNPLVWEDHAQLDPDNDALNNLEECYTDPYGSNPFYKDVFLEFDWTTPQTPGVPSNKPSIELLNQSIALFEQHFITLHVDLGDLGGGEEIPGVSNFSYSDLRDLYWDHFLHNNLNNPRKGIFHYCLVCDYGPGAGFAFIGWDHLDSFDISAQMLVYEHTQFERDILIVGGAIHELGHTFGLNVDDHGGNDNRGAAQPFSRQWFKYRNYQSCMNYWYTYRIFGFSDGTHGRGDFDDWGNMDFSFFKNTHFQRLRE
jgi:parallel beta-helix repeat protein